MLGHAQMKHPFEVAISGPKRLGEFDGARLTNGINDCLEYNGAEADATVVEIFVRYELVGVAAEGGLNATVEAWPDRNEHGPRRDIPSSTVS